MARLRLRLAGRSAGRAAACGYKLVFVCPLPSRESLQGARAKQSRCCALVDSITTVGCHSIAAMQLESRHRRDPGPSPLWRRLRELYILHERNRAVCFSLIAFSSRGGEAVMETACASDMKVTEWLQVGSCPRNCGATKLLFETGPPELAAGKGPGAAFVIVTPLGASSRVPENSSRSLNAFLGTAVPGRAPVVQMWGELAEW